MISSTQRFWYVFFLLAETDYWRWPRFSQFGGSTWCTRFVSPLLSGSQSSQILTSQKIWTSSHRKSPTTPVTAGIYLLQCPRSTCRVSEKVFLITSSIAFRGRNSRDYLPCPLVSFFSFDWRTLNIVFCHSFFANRVRMCKKLPGMLHTFLMHLQWWRSGMLRPLW